MRFQGERLFLPRLQKHKFGVCSPEIEEQSNPPTRPRWRSGANRCLVTIQKQVAHANEAAVAIMG